MRRRDGRAARVCAAHTARSFLECDLVARHANRSDRFSGEGANRNAYRNGPWWQPTAISGLIGCLRNRFYADDRGANGERNRDRGKQRYVQHCLWHQRVVGNDKCLGALTARTATVFGPIVRPAYRRADFFLRKPHGVSTAAKVRP
jgi:hypothetical protein